MGAESADATAGLTPGVRYCPRCSLDTQLSICPIDGTPTFTRSVLGTGRAAFGLGDIIGGRYRITGVLGVGGFGAVYDAEHVVTGQAAAVKVMVGEPGSMETEAVQRFLQEARVTASLNHPNTVRIYDFGQTEGGVLFMAMERLRGQTLSARMAEGPIPEAETLSIGIQTLRSLTEAHAAGLVHRDLKPANLMLADVVGEDTIVKVLDFGIARTHDSAITQTGIALGTPLYMSPEQGRGEPLDGRSDLYALGCILHACVCGKAPFEDANPMVVMLKHQLDPLPELAENAQTPVSQAFIDVVRVATAKVPEHRFPNAVTMREALEAAQANLRAHPQPPPHLSPNEQTIVTSLAMTTQRKPLTAPQNPESATLHLDQTVVHQSVPFAMPQKAPTLAMRPSRTAVVRTLKPPTQQQPAVQEPTLEPPKRKLVLPLVLLAVGTLSALGIWLVVREPEPPSHANTPKPEMPQPPVAMQPPQPIQAMAPDVLQPDVQAVELPPPPVVPQVIAPTPTTETPPEPPPAQPAVQPTLQPPVHREPPRPHPHVAPIQRPPVNMRASPQHDSERPPILQPRPEPPRTQKPQKGLELLP